ncbi:MAG: GAF domain-containing protein [Mastigocoleus sp.]
MRQPQKFTAAEHQIVSLGHILQNLREEDNVDALIDKTIIYLKENFEYSLIWIALYDPLNHILHGKGGIIPGNDTTPLTQRLVISSGDLLEQVVIEQRPLGVADLRVETRTEGWREVAQKNNLQGTIILPIHHRERCLGIVLLASKRWGYLIAGEARAKLMLIVGQLAANIHQHDVEVRHKQVKRADEPMVKLLENLRNLSDLDKRLEAVVYATQDFIGASRTNIYWFERKGRYFWQRFSSKGKFNYRKEFSQKKGKKITIQDLSDFYYTLAMGQIVFVGEGRSSLKSHFTTKILETLHIRSLLAAPIIWQKELLGFLAVEDRDSRIWGETQKTFVRGAAGLVSLVAPVEKIESTIEQVKEDAQMNTGLLKGICEDDDLGEILKDCAAKVLKRLSANQFFVLQYDSERSKYQVFYQDKSHKEQDLESGLSRIQEVDLQLLKNSFSVIDIENIEDDLRLYNWRSDLTKLGVRSLIVCSCLGNDFPSVLLMVSSDIHRSWNSLEKELIQAVGRQIGVVVRQGQLHQMNQQRQQILASFHQCLRTLESAQNNDADKGENYLEKVAMEQIASVLNSPLILLLTWKVGESVAKIIPGVNSDHKFGFSTDAVIPLQNEALVHWAFQTDGLFSLQVKDLLPDTRKWLHGSGIGEILIIALRTTSKHEPTGVLVIADYHDRRWSEQSLSAVETLVCQLAWSRRQQQIARTLKLKTENLQQINWYKHRLLEEYQTNTSSLVHKIQELEVTGNKLVNMRYQQLLRQFEQTASSVTGVIEQEKWTLQNNPQKKPIAAILKQSLEQVDFLIKEKRLWIGVHGLGQQVSENSYDSDYIPNFKSSLLLIGDIEKIELVIHEILIVACDRSEVGGRIDIWCRRLEDKSFLEVSITDNGVIELGLLEDLNDYNSLDILAPSTLEKPPGLNLLICQQIIQQLGDELHFYQLPDGRLVSRLLLSLAAKNKSTE